MAITTAAAWKTYRQIDSGVTTWDTLLAALIPQVQAEMEAQCDRVFDTATYTDEAYDGDGSQELQLRNWPVTALSAIEVLADDATTTTLASSDYRWAADGRVVRLPYRSGGSYLAVDEYGQALGYAPSGAVFAEGFRNILVTYTAGYATMPANLVLAAHYLLDTYMERRGFPLHVSSSGQGGENTSARSAADAHAAYINLLRPFRRLPS